MTSTTAREHPRFLILNADDFGYSPEVNAAVVRAHRAGTLTSASLMVAEQAWEEAVEVAHRNPKLGVGLHVSVTYDRSILSPAEIPGLVDSEGKFGKNPFRVGLRYAISRKISSQLLREMEAQFARFAGTGLPWSHADGHQHFHLHPAVWAHFLDLCDGYGVMRLRLPHESVRAHLKSGGDRSAANIAALLAFRALRRRALQEMKRRERRSNRVYFTCDRVYGMLQTGNMKSGYTSGLLSRLEGVTNEIYFHPASPHAVVLHEDCRRSNVCDVELDALLEPSLVQQITSHGIDTGTYPEVELMEADYVASRG